MMRTGRLRGTHLQSPSYAETGNDNIANFIQGTYILIPKPYASAFTPHIKTNPCFFPLIKEIIGAKSDGENRQAQAASHSRQVRK